MGQQLLPDNHIAVVTIHGTGDTAPSLRGEKWFQQGATFTERLKARLKQHGLEADILPHLWSGANSALERERGADKLADYIRRADKTYRGRLHLVGHSHGGNVANEAIDALRWGRRMRKNERIASVTTVGTPFFKISTGRLESIAGIAFLGITILLSALAAIFVVAMGVMMATGQLSFQSAENELQDITTSTLTHGFIIAMIAAEVVALVFMLRLAFEGARRILRPRRVASSKKSVHAIWHPNDEAIAFLQKVEEAPIEPFTRGSLYRGSRTAAIDWGVRAAIFLPLILALFYGMKAAGVRGAPGLFSSGGDDATNIFLFLLAMPLLFSTVYLGFRFFFGLIPEHTVRGSLNKLMAGILRGMAFGRDGDQVIGNTSTGSHTHPTQGVVLTGPVAERMQTNSAAAATKLIEAYRWALFSVGEDSNQALSRLATDAMTWDSLIHTTYFDQPEMADLIGDYIAAKHAEQRGESRSPALLFVRSAAH
jgi:hypothetical protein